MKHLLTTRAIMQKKNGVKRADDEIKKCISCFKCCNNACYQNHLKNVCKKIKKCDTCGAFKTYKHNCDLLWFNFCKTNIDNNHKCLILKEKSEKEVKFNGFILFDYERMQVGDSNHEPNLVVATRLCIECLNNTTNCDICETKVFRSNEDFCLWLFNTINKNFIAIAHNMKSYDGFFIMNFIIKNLLPTDILPEILLNGSKLLVI
jgi:hypothetical protein